MASDKFREVFLQSISFYYFADSEGPLIFPANKYKPSESWFYFISTKSDKASPKEATTTLNALVSSSISTSQSLDLNATPISDVGSSLLRKRLPHASLTLEYV